MPTDDSDPSPWVRELKHAQLCGICGKPMVGISHECTLNQIWREVKAELDAAPPTPLSDD